MITRKALISKLETMATSDILVRYGDYRNAHPMAATPLQKAMAQLVAVSAVEARSYTAKNGTKHSSPAWLIEAYKCLTALIYRGQDINVRMLISAVK